MEKILYNNVARPKVFVVMWLACHERLATKKRLHIFGMLDNDNCCFCPKVETIQYLLFKCDELGKIWKYILEWLRIQHDPIEWKED